ncbi:uncharacterized protein LOC133665626 [Apis cerana]|uniref:uncharacterized protein LOC133665626 n=1 Tax=Apis cerana TaxID=7461 RepID=UPI002B2247A5|nr:uncharacterized protein LOC133665626 [Apis cerana]
MKTVVSVAYPSLDGRHRASILICFVFIIALPILASSHDQKNGHGSAYTSKSEDKMEFSKNSKDSKISLLDDESDDSGGEKDHKMSAKDVEENSPALAKFLDDVLKAQDDLKWIDQTVRNVNREKNLEKLNKKDIHPSSDYDKDTAGEQVPKDWTKSKDLCSLNDWLNFNKNLAGKRDKSANQMIHECETNQKNRFSSLSPEKSAKGDIKFNVRNQRDEARKKEAPSLESLKETILELKKNLKEADKKQHDNLKNEEDTADLEENENEKLEHKDRTTRAKNKHRKTENDDDVS